MTGLFEIKEYNKFRHAAELRKDTHGGYLDGFLLIPKELIGYDFELELSLVSSSLSSRNEHPNLLHFTELQVGKKKRKVSAYKTEVTHNSWKTAFYFPGSGTDVLHYFKDDRGKDQIIKISDCRKEDTIIFGGDFGLTLTIITPLQNTGTRGKGVTINQVLDNRYSSQSTDWLKSTDSHDPKIELHRCRMQAVFRCPIKNFEASILSNNIFDLSNKYVGMLSILAIHNIEDSIIGAIGKKEVVLITKQKINPKEVFPDIMIKSDEGIYVDPCQIFPGFIRISQDTTKCYHNTTVIFDIPSQTPKVLDQLNGNVFYICLNRRNGRRISDPIKSFTYSSDLTQELEALLNIQSLLPVDWNEEPFRNIPSVESGFVSGEPSPSVYSSQDEQSLTPNDDMFQSYLDMDIDMADPDLLNFPFSTDNPSNEKINAEKKDFNTLKEIFEDTFSNDNEEVVKGFPTLTFDKPVDESPIQEKEETLETTKETKDFRDLKTHKWKKESFIVMTMVPLFAIFALYFVKKEFFI